MWEAKVLSKELVSKLDLTNENALFHMIGYNYTIPKASSKNEIVRHTTIKNLCCYAKNKRCTILRSSTNICCAIFWHFKG